MKELGHRVRKGCMGNMPSAGEMNDYEEDLVDAHDKGIWKGWVFHAEITEEGATPIGPTYL